jgi:hypothetical protein
LQVFDFTTEKLYSSLMVGFIVHEARFFISDPFCTSAKPQLS